MDKSNPPSDQTIKLTSLKVYPAILAAVGVAIALLAIGRYWGASQQSMSTDVDTSRLSPDIPAAPSDPTGTNSTTGDQLLTEQPSAPASNAISAANPDTDTSENSTTAFNSNLRVSNRTTHPIRVALLAKADPATASSTTSSTTASPDTSSTYGVPVHWDFAPGEGSQQGLLLSLPDQTIQLQAGDILVAFAQDGSRVYWGPYVVDQTNLPLWNDAQQEWQLILEP